MSYTLNCSILLTELPLLERAEAARQAGFDSVEFWWPFAEAVPGDKQVDEFIASLSNAGVQLDGLNFFAGDMPAGDRGLVSWKGRCSEFKDNVDVVAAIAEATGCTSFNALYGNRLPDYTPEEQDELAIKNLLAATEGVAKIGGTVLIEPVSGTEAYPLKTSADALKVVEAIKAEGNNNIALLADFYHLSVNGDDVPALIEAHAKDFGHIQIADAPGRGAPGTGNLPLLDWINRSVELGYTGKVALEYKQDRATAFDWLTTATANA
ncbi:hydroxypyruvate isomerase family protein [Arthrobacter sp. NIO-1057]|uniref:hydroxypyruvate isomerase family protein n=1 Tax=Arthrobacter sp. NIO-1057 TaxID=993071 RepID=UPI00071C8903|nr:TIM barrel protein [Arthrobacter sp. NIO-1057]KSU66056.1 hydroxypyruvate isomerase [Arthrobacter sp. NIO-1057]SCC31034.1 hydroxypyruvate isomerase [Arthrobacter sp. NIO-1057]